MKPLRLAQQTALLLAAAFLAVELLAALSFAAFVMLPLAQRSTDDLAGLMILAAQTWVELPPKTRPAFEHKLMDNHQLALRAEPAGQGRDEWHAPYFYLLEAALSRRLGEVRHLASERIGDVAWYWADIPTGAGTLAVGLLRARLATQPYSALALALGGGFVLAIGEEMNALIATLLDLARGLGREPLQETDLAAVLDELAEMAAAAGREISVNCPPCTRPIARHALRRALSNLLDNALRHAPTGPIELVCIQGQGACRLGVLDRGPGIPPERIEAMFEPFQRLESSRSPQTGGAGLGLAIVRELARANGWQVR